MKALAFAVASSVVALGCSRTPAAQTPTPPAATAAAPAPAQDHPPSRSVVHIAEDIRRACGIGDADAHFEFDSARVRAMDYPTLDKLVSCFGSGPLAKRQMRLVGHADPRGSEEYNVVLGGSRADAVKSFIVGRGLDGEQAATTSRGEMEAKGTDEASWALDRRVDVVLAN